MRKVHAKGNCLRQNEGFRLKDDIDHFHVISSQQRKLELCVLKHCVKGLGVDPFERVRSGCLIFFQELYDEGHLAFAANVGSLAEPVNKTSYLHSDKKKCVAGRRLVSRKGGLSSTNLGARTHLDSKFRRGNIMSSGIQLCRSLDW